jgi:hypothetical protein
LARNVFTDSRDPSECCEIPPATAAAGSNDGGVDFAYLHE